jgi:hypothetical protein
MEITEIIRMPRAMGMMTDIRRKSVEYCSVIDC